MNVVANHEFMDVHSLHQHQPHCKQQCFVFTEISDIELPPEITKFCGGNGGGSEKLKNGGITTYNNKKDTCSDSSTEHPETSKLRKIVLGLGLALICIAMAGGIPLALQLRSSSLLEARLAFIRRLLTESPLIEGSWKPRLDLNYSSSMFEIRQNHIGAVLWPIAVPCGSQYLDAVQLTLEGIDEAKRITAVNAMHIVESADEMEQAHIRGEVAVLMGIGGGHALGTSLAVLRSMYLLGARFVSVTSLECTIPWAAAAIRSRDYLFEENATNSLNDFGKTVIFEMNRLGMLVEISQLSEVAMISVLRTANAPVLFMNSAPLSLCNNTISASIPDHILSLLPENGGVILLNLEHCGDRSLNVREAINTINYVRKIAGVDHIGLGGAPKSYALLLAELARDRVWGNAAIKKLIGGNVVRILREVETLKNRSPLHEEWIPHALIESNSYCRYPES